MANAFDARFRECLYLLLDEAIWAGDKAGRTEEAPIPRMRWNRGQGMLPNKRRGLTAANDCRLAARLKAASSAKARRRPIAAQPLPRLLESVCMSIGRCKRAGVTVRKKSNRHGANPVPAFEAATLGRRLGTQGIPWGGPRPPLSGAQRRARAEQAKLGRFDWVEWKSTGTKAARESCPR
jgi:hypothetical protein